MPVGTKPFTVPDETMTFWVSTFVNQMGGVKFMMVFPPDPDAGG